MHTRPGAHVHPASLVCVCPRCEFDSVIAGRTPWVRRRWPASLRSCLVHCQHHRHRKPFDAKRLRSEKPSSLCGTAPNHLSAQPVSRLRARTDQRKRGRSVSGPFPFSQRRSIQLLLRDARERHSFLRPFLQHNPRLDPPTYRHRHLRLGLIGPYELCEPGK